MPFGRRLGRDRHAFQPELPMPPKILPWLLDFEMLIGNGYYISKYFYLTHFIWDTTLLTLVVSIFFVSRQVTARKPEIWAPI